jgi:hypothetical protein
LRNPEDIHHSFPTNFLFSFFSAKKANCINTMVKAPAFLLLVSLFGPVASFQSLVRPSLTARTLLRTNAETEGSSSLASDILEESKAELLRTHVQLPAPPNHPSQQSRGKSKCWKN